MKTSPQHSQSNLSQDKSVMKMIAEKEVCNTLRPVFHPAWSFLHVNILHVEIKFSYIQYEGR